MERKSYYSEVEDMRAQKKRIIKQQGYCPTQGKQEEVELTYVEISTLGSVHPQYKEMQMYCPYVSLMQGNCEIYNDCPVKKGKPCGSESDDHYEISKIREFIERGNAIENQIHSNIRSEEDIIFAYMHGTEYETWVSELKLFVKRNLSKHELYDDIITVLHKYDKDNPDRLDEIIGKLQTVHNDKEFFEREHAQTSKGKNAEILTNLRDVFIVHGHDSGAKEEVARFVERLRLNAVILHEQPDVGQTVIEKFTKHSDVGYAIILYTPCDEGKAITESAYKKRARQNVIFEHGYFVAKLGRSNVCALVRNDVEIPSDLSGVLYIPMDGQWKYRVIDELKEAGYAVSKDMI